MPPRVLLLDVANTLLEKRGLADVIASTLADHGHHLPPAFIATRHKLLSEVIRFPDRTSEDFYRSFNEELLLSLGVVPEADLLHAIYQRCRRLPWQPFDDVVSLGSLGVRLGIVSNWDTSLESHLSRALPSLRFEHIIGSQQCGIAKPDPRIFELALERTGISASEAIYVGDSLRLDVIPALRVGLQAVLVDRNDLFPHSSVLRVRSLADLPRLLEERRS